MRWVPTHRSLATALILFGCAGLFVGCGRSGVSDDNLAGEHHTTGAGQAPPTPPTMGVTVGPRGGGNADSVVDCHGVEIPMAAFDDVVLLSDHPLPTAAMEPLDEFLMTGEGDFWPQDGYWVLELSAASFLLVHHDRATGALTMLGTERGDDNTWQATTILSGGPCEFRSILPDGFGIVTWRVDPDRPSTPADTHLDLLATGQACSSGQAMGDRLAEPTVTTTEAAVLIGLLARLPIGAQTCPGNPEETVRVELGEPLGERDVLDALRTGMTLADVVPPSP